MKVQIGDKTVNIFNIVMELAVGIYPPIFYASLDSDAGVVLNITNENTLKMEVGDNKVDMEILSIESNNMESKIRFTMKQSDIFNDYKPIYGKSSDVIDNIIKLDGNIDIKNKDSKDNLWYAPNNKNITLLSYSLLGGDNIKYLSFTTNNYLVRDIESMKNNKVKLDYKQLKSYKYERKDYVDSSNIYKGVNIRNPNSEKGKPINFIEINDIPKNIAKNLNIIKGQGSDLVKFNSRQKMTPPIIVELVDKEGNTVRDIMIKRCLWYMNEGKKSETEVFYEGALL